MKLIATLFLFMSLFLIAQADDAKMVIDKDLNNHYITIADKSYKVLEFKKRIKNIKVSDSEKISIEFVDTGKPLQSVKIFAIGIGYANALFTFNDDSTAQVNFNIVNDLKSIINMIEVAYPEMKITQVGDNIVLKGTINTTKDKRKVLEILEKAGVDTEVKVIDTAKVNKPENMIRIKLYAVEINNNKGETFKNNWVASSKNFVSISNGTSYTNTSLSSVNTENRQRNYNLEQALDGIVTDAVTVTGGLTGIANYLGDFFNVGLTLNYLSENNIARILDETTLMTTEGNTANFLAGGYITVRTTTTTAQGVPSTELKTINYGLKLNFNVDEIINGEYVHITINTEQSDTDWINTVDSIPAITTKSIETNVIAKNGSTIVLGGLIQKDQNKNLSKIPFLGDIPVLGALFRSSDFQNEDSELVFFITPEIVNTVTNEQSDKLLKIKKDISDLNKQYKDDDEKKEVEKETSTATEKKESSQPVPPTNTKVAITQNDTQIKQRPEDVLNSFFNY